jgi:hypothetical protein
MRQLFLSSLLLLLCISAPAGAKDAPDHQAIAFSPTQFSAQREAIIKGLRSSTYRELSDADRENVLDALSRMQDKLDGVERLEQLDKRDQIAVFNDQELVNTLLTQAAADSQLICKREKFVGSHRVTNVCLTVAERRRLAAVAQEQMRGLQRSPKLEDPAGNN